MSLADDPTIIPLPTPPASASSTETEAGTDFVPTGPLPRGASVGRYVVLDELGVGAMGRVYAAYDPRLDRKVALKLIRSPLGTGSRPERAAARLLAEAQALAQLAHPNVVGVHDVEIVDGSVAIAMELVPGTTLRRWLATSPAWREVVRVFVAAGAGLAAAHRAGIVHRDFKPDNVMLGDDGRARVVDFGLARSDAPVSGSGSPEQSMANDGAIELVTAATAGIAGTPAYMAPEIYGGAAADARSDQFSFCVALHEALYGRRPFAGTTPATLLAAVVAGEIVPPESGSKVPTWVHRIVVRGLAADPAARHLDIDALLSALLRDPSARRRHIAVASASIAVFAGGVAVTWRAAQPDDPCAKVGAELRGVWDDDVRRAIGAALSATGVPWAETARAEVERRLDAFAADFVEMARDNCLATHVRREQSEAMLDLRATCLNARHRELAATTRVLMNADVDIARETVRILDSLGPIDACADLEGLRQALAPPDDPAMRSQVEALRETLAEIEVTTRAGKFVDAHRRAVDVVVKAEALDYPPLVAEAKHALGYLEDKVGDYAGAEITLTEAALLAQRHRHDKVAARAMADAVFVIGSQLARVDDALIWARHADAAAGRTGDDLLVAKALSVRGVVLDTAGRFAEAEQVTRASLDLRIALLGERSLDVSISLLNLGVALEGQGRDAEALAAYDRARAIDEDLLGADHPRVASELNNAVTSLVALGRTADALASARRAEAIYRATLPDDHPNIAAVLGSVANALSASGDKPGARTATEQQLEINQRRLGNDHPDVALAHHNLGSIEYDLGNMPRATEHFARAAAIYAAAYGPDHPELAGPLSALGHVEQESGHHAAARDHFKRAIAILDAAGLGSRIELPIALRSLAESCLALAELDAAEAAARRSLALFSSQPQWADRRSSTLWGLARVIHARGDRAQALALAREAIEHCGDGVTEDHESECTAYVDELDAVFGAAP